MARELAAVRLPEVTVLECTLWRSILGPSGPRYEVLATVPAAPASA
jgi:2'-5' RNA ligase